MNAVAMRSEQALPSRAQQSLVKGLLLVALTSVLEARAGESGEVRPRCITTSANGLVMIASDQCVRELSMQEGRAAFSGAIAAAIEGSTQGAPKTAPGGSARALVELGDKSFWESPPKWGAGSKAITEPYFGKMP